MQNEGEVDPDWRPPRVPAPDPKPFLTVPRKMFILRLGAVPVRIDSCPALRGDRRLLLVHGRRADLRSLSEVPVLFLARDVLPLGAEPAGQPRS